MPSDERPFARRVGVAVVIVSAALLAACAGPHTLRNARQGESYRTVASWYGKPFHGQPTASGEIFDMHALTTAHRHLPFGTRLKVTHPQTGRSVTVTVNDRGPFIRGRHLDLSFAAARKIGLVENGVDWVDVKILDRDLRYRKYLVDGVLPGVPVHARPGEKPYTLQFGAFEQQANALRLKQGLEIDNPGTYITETRVDGRRFYRVRMGAYASETEARRRAEVFAEEGYSVLIVLR